MDSLKEFGQRLASLGNDVPWKVKRDASIALYQEMKSTNSNAFQLCIDLFRVQPIPALDSVEATNRLLELGVTIDRRLLSRLKPFQTGTKFYFNKYGDYHRTPTPYSIVVLEINHVSPKYVYLVYPYNAGLSTNRGKSATVNTIE